jgi:protein-L-isoaspartate(D-aspartate) O-methyltransferase
MSDYRVARERMVTEQLRRQGIDAPRVIAAMREVQRHLFVPRLLRGRAYLPCALPIGYGQTISRPFTVALMTALLELRGHERVLEIGTGSGYQSAILSRLTAEVVSLERVVPLAERASRTLAAAGLENVRVIAADGRSGCPELAPFDAIVVTACAPAPCEPLLEQLVDGGILLLPLGRDGNQALYRFRRQGEGVQVQRSLSCRFVPLQPGLVAGAEHV